MKWIIMAKIHHASHFLSVYYFYELQTNYMDTILEHSDKKILNHASFRRLGFDKQETKDLVGHLNELLANYHVHYQKLRNFHWNVSGKDFFDLHDTFERLYEKAFENIDDVAERIRVFGHTPYSKLQTFLDESEIQEADTKLSADEMVRETLRDLTILISYMVSANEAAQKIGDLGTIDMLNGFVKGMEKEHWMLNAFLQEEVS